MCVLFVAYGVHPRYPLLVASNRDEFHGRPAAPAAPWGECSGVLAGRDLRAGGTWAGLATGGRWAALTNIRAPQWMGRAAPRSRGALVAEFLCGGPDPARYAAAATAERDEYGGFNLLVGSAGALWYASSHRTAPQRLAPGFYGLSNGVLDEPWPKVTRGRAAFQAWVESLGEETPALDAESVFAFMRDEARAPDADLPATGVGVENERFLSPLFIVGAEYGTRATTLLAVGEGTARLVERSYAPDGTSTGTVAHDLGF